MPRLGNSGVELGYYETCDGSNDYHWQKISLSSQESHKRDIVNGNGNAAQATAAMPAVTPTPCGINVRISESANPSYHHK